MQNTETTTYSPTDHDLCTCTLAEFGGIEKTDPYCPWGVHTD